MTGITGQWLGMLSGQNRGFLTLNVEERNPFLGRLAFEDFNHENPPIIGAVLCQVQGTRVTGELKNIYFFRSDRNGLLSWEEVKKEFPGSDFTRTAKLDAVLEGDKLTGTWVSDVPGWNGTFDLRRPAIPNEFPADKQLQWDEFKAWITKETPGKQGFIYRGQLKGWPLRTLYHRLGRNDLLAYDIQDVRKFSHFINASSSYRYRLNDIEDYGALLSLGQHHGFPTPLLDWTRSPYVAAFFAYRELEKTPQQKWVRIFAFDVENWVNQTTTAQVVSILDPRPTITVRELPAHNNPRAIPQQSVATFTNIEGMEEFVRIVEDLNKARYLEKIDLDARERNRAMRELQVMGITAASLFPGFDGICDYLREDSF